MTVRPVGVDLFHAGGQTDTTKLVVAFPNFATAPQHVVHIITTAVKKSKTKW